MAKIRGIKPEFWTDDDVIELSIPARLLFIGMWNFACDNGHLQDKAKQIKMRILPADDVDAESLLSEMQILRLIERADGWITIPTLSRHQKPHKRWWSTCERPGCVPPAGASSTPGNRGATVAKPLRHGSATADGDGDGDNSSSEVADATPRPDVNQILDLLDAEIERNGAHKPARTKKNIDAARLILDRDGRTVDQVSRAIVWCQHDEFWRSNILSMSKLREKYDQLQLAAKRDKGGGVRDQKQPPALSVAEARQKRRDAEERSRLAGVSRGA